MLTLKASQPAGPMVTKYKTMVLVKSTSDADIDFEAPQPQARKVRYLRIQVTKREKPFDPMSGNITRSIEKK